MFKKIVLSVLAFSLLCGASSAHNQQCGERAKVLQLLKGERFGESGFATGKSGNGQLLFEFFVNAATGSFTVLSTIVFSRNADGKIVGRSCIVIGGEKFQFNENQEVEPEPTKHTRLYQVPTVLPF